MKKNRYSHGFTLVELIVVATILAILGAVGFASYTSYISGSRDANRLSQLVSISDGLNLQSTKSKLPTPDDSIEIQANGIIVAYQGLAGTSVLETIGYSKGGKDPKDNSFFSYYVTKKKSHFQLMGMYEDQENASALLGGEAYASDYLDRIPFVYGDSLGVLTDSTNTPAEQLGSDIDIATTPTTYKAYLDDSQFIEGDSSALSQLENVLKVGGVGYSYKNGSLAYSDPEKTIPREGLILQYLFEDNSVDDSGNGNTTNEIGTVAYTGGIILHQGTLGKALVMDGSTTLQVSSNEYIDQQQGGFTWSFWMKGLGDQVVSYARVVDFSDTSLAMSSGIGTYLRGWIDSDGSRSTIINATGIDYLDWRHVVFQRDGEDVYLYIDNTLIGTEAKGGSLDAVTSGATFNVGDSSSTDFYGLVDNLRVYNRKINEDEIQSLFQERDIK